MGAFWLQYGLLAGVLLVALGAPCGFPDGLPSVLSLWVPFVWCPGGIPSGVRMGSGWFTYGLPVGPLISVLLVSL